MSSAEYSGSDRRREPRYATTDRAEVTIATDRQLEISGRVVDVSRFGIRLELFRPLDQGTKVKVMFRRPAVIVGEVRHCWRVGEAFQVGIQIEKVLISPNRHVDDDELALYVSGKGLTEPEFFYVRQHFSECQDCQRRLREREEPVR